MATGRLKQSVLCDHICLLERLLSSDLESKLFGREGGREVDLDWGQIMCTCFVLGAILNVLFSCNSHSHKWELVAVVSETLDLPVVSQVLTVLSGQGQKFSHVSVLGTSHQGDR